MGIKVNVGSSVPPASYDATVAHLAGNQTFSGINKFSNDLGLVEIQDAAGQSIVMDFSNAAIGFFGTGPKTRQAAPALPAATGSTNVTPFGYTQAQADALVTAVRALITIFSSALGGNGLIS